MRTIGILRERIRRPQWQALVTIDDSDSSICALRGNERRKVGGMNVEKERASRPLGFLLTHAFEEKERVLVGEQREVRRPRPSASARLHR